MMLNYKFVVYNNVEDANIFFSDTDDEFIFFAKNIYSENEEYTEEIDLPKPIETLDDAINYINTYCGNLDLQLTLNK